MNARFTCLVTSLFLVSASAPLHAQPVITGLHGNGQLTWTNAPGTNCFGIQWAPSAAGPWASSYLSFRGIITTNEQTTIPVPMFYRVAQRFDQMAMLGTWMSVNPGTANNMFFITQSDGIIAESAMFFPRSPQGYVKVEASGLVTNTFIGADGIIEISGRFVSADQIASDPPYADYSLQRVTDEGRCAGNWSGMLVQTQGPGIPFSRSLAFKVDNRGLVTGVTGFTGNGIGRLFALSTGQSVGFFYLGRESENGVYWQTKITGTLVGNTFTGVYFTDSGDGPDAVQGTVSLSR